MDGKHSPGPWRVTWGTDNDGTAYFDVLVEDGDADDDGRLVDASYSIIEMAYPVDDDEDLYRANANLIAAAPDLLSALTGQRCFDCGQWIEVTPGRRSPCVACAPAFAAVAKALGKEPDRG